MSNRVCSFCHSEGDPERSYWPSEDGTSCMCSDCSLDYAKSTLDILNQADEATQEQAKGACSFCYSEEDNRVYWHAEEGAACMCGNCCMQFARAVLEKREEDSGNEAQDSLRDENQQFQEYLEVPEDISGVDQASPEFALWNVWINNTPEDGWNLDLEEKSFVFPDGVKVTALMEEIDDAQFFLECYDEMKLYKCKAVEEISFADNDASIKFLEDAGNMYIFTYNYDFSDAFDSSGSGEDLTAILRFLQFGEGFDMAYDAYISTDLDGPSFKQWVENVLEKGSLPVEQ